MTTRTAAEWLAQAAVEFPDSQVEQHAYLIGAFDAIDHVGGAVLSGPLRPMRIALLDAAKEVSPS